MALATFTPDPPPSPGTKRKPKLKILKADFGDGYTQPTPDGLNFIRRTISLQWNLLTPAQADALEAFFVANVTLPFWYQPSDESAPGKWTCEDWDFTTRNGGFRSGRAALVQDFNALT
jgi:phage-related protein